MTVVEAPEKIAINRLVGKILVVEYPDMFKDDADWYINLRIFIQIICKNMEQDIEISLRMAKIAIKEVVNM